MTFIFFDGLECLYVKYKSRASTACELPDYIWGFLPVKTWLLIACNTAFYAIIFIKKMKTVQRLDKIKQSVIIDADSVELYQTLHSVFHILSFYLAKLCNII